MNKIVEIIPDDIPEWAQVAMDNGQLFNEMLSRIKRSNESLAEAKREADNLALSLWSRYYKIAAPNFKLLNDVAGVITQIDNMVAGLNQKRT